MESNALGSQVKQFVSDNVQLEVDKVYLQEYKLALETEYKRLSTKLSKSKSSDVRLINELTKRKLELEDNISKINESIKKLADENLVAEEEKFRVGLTTNFEVLQSQRDLATARINTLNAIISYNLALAQLNKAMGITLKEKNVQISSIRNP